MVETSIMSMRESWLSKKYMGLCSWGSSWMSRIMRALPSREVRKVMSTMEKRNIWVWVWLKSPARMKFISVVSFASSIVPDMPGKQGMIRRWELLERKVKHLLKKRWSKGRKKSEAWGKNYAFNFSLPDKMFALASLSYISAVITQYLFIPTNWIIRIYSSTHYIYITSVYLVSMPHIIYSWY